MLVEGDAAVLVRGCSGDKTLKCSGRETLQ